MEIGSKSVRQFSGPGLEDSRTPRFSNRRPDLSIWPELKLQKLMPKLSLVPYVVSHVEVVCRHRSPNNRSDPNLQLVRKTTNRAELAGLLRKHLLHGPSEHNSLARVAMIFLDSERPFVRRPECTTYGALSVPSQPWLSSAYEAWTQNCSTTSIFQCECLLTWPREGQVLQLAPEASRKQEMPYTIFPNDVHGFEFKFKAFCLFS